MTERPARIRFTLEDVRRRAVKPRDSWWTVFLVDPLAVPLSLVTANHTSLTPNQLTVLSFGAGLAASWFFWIGTTGALIAGAILFYVSFTLDCVDGKIARLKGTGSPFGEWFDYVLDRIRVLIATVALMAGQFRLTDDERFLYLALLVIFLDMLRYLDALKLQSLQQSMRAQVREAKRQMGLPLDEGDVEPGRGEEDQIQRGVATRFGRLRRIRDALDRRRVRSHMISGIEFQMFVFVLGPVTGQVEQLVYTASALLLVFEGALVVKLWLATKEVRRTLFRIRAGGAP